MKKILLLIFIISVSLYGQFEKKEPTVSGEIYWGDGFENTKVGKNWYEYVVYDNSTKALTTKVIQTNQNICKFVYQKGDKYLEYICLFKVNNDGLYTNLKKIRVINSQTNESKNFNTDWIITTADNQYARYFFKQEHEMFYKVTDRFGDTNIYKTRFSECLSYFCTIGNIAYSRKVFDYNKDKEPLTKYQGLVKFRAGPYYPKAIVLATELLVLNGLEHSFSSSSELLKANKEIFNSDEMTRLADLGIVDIFLKVGMDFDKEWDVIYESRFK